MASLERLKGIEVFIAVADAGSFTAAAKRLNLTNSAVGKTIARLEARLNTRLFERTTRRLFLTDAGTAFYTTCARVLDELHSAEQVLAADRLEPVGRLRVDVPVTFGRLRVMPLLLRYAEQHPAVRLHVSFTDRFVDVVEESIDVCIRIGGADTWPASLGHRYLERERLIFCASPAYLARRGVPGSVDDLRAHDTVTYGRADGSASAWLIAGAADAIQRWNVEGRIVVGHGDAQVEAVLAGSGIAQLATWLVQEHLASGRLVELLPHAATQGLPLHLVWPRSRQLLPKINGLLTLLGDALGIQ